MDLNFGSIASAFQNGFDNYRNALFPLEPNSGVDDELQRAAQRQAMMRMAFGIMAGKGLGQGLAQGYGMAANQYQAAMENAYTNTLHKRAIDLQQQQLDRQAKVQAKQDRESAAVTAGRLSAGISQATDPGAYWRLVESNPDAQAALQSFGLQVPANASGDQIRSIGQSLGTESQLSAPVTAARDLNLKSVVGPNGKPVLVPEAAAIGAQPWEKPQEPPISWAEYLQAQKDPEFKKFLQERRGKGMSITTPDGTVIDMGGAGSNIGPGELQKPVVTKLQESIVTSQNRLDSLNNVMATFDPKFLQVQGLTKASTIKAKDWAGGLLGDVTPQQRDYLQKYSEFMANASNDFNQVIHDLSGAATSESEGQRISKGAPTPNDGPIEFQSKAKATIKNITRATMRANWALKNGIGLQSAEQLSRIMPLDGIDAVYEQRANQIYGELKAKGDPNAKQNAITRANQEFGLAR